MKKVYSILNNKITKQSIKNHKINKKKKKEVAADNRLSPAILDQNGC